MLDELASAYSELEEVKNQIMILGERLMEEQDTNKRTKELAASLECKYSNLTFICFQTNLQLIFLVLFIHSLKHTHFLSTVETEHS